jgi:ABC-type multidrug transport system fused ATPase/permease subunit
VTIIFTNQEVDRIKTEMKKKQNQRSFKIRLIWGCVLLFFIILMVIYQTTHWKRVDENSIALINITILLFIFAIVFFISLFYVSEKNYYDYLCETVYKKIETDNQISLDYEAYDKDRTFLDQGKVLSSFAKTLNRRHLTTQTKSGVVFQIRDCFMSSGVRYQTKYFEGLYIIVHINLNEAVQIRTHSKPDNSIGEKLKLVEKIDDLKVFKPIDENMTSIDKILVDYVKELQNTGHFDHIYLGVLDEEVHLVLSFYSQAITKDVEITKDKLNNLYKNLYSEYKLAYKFSEKLNEQVLK